MYLFACNFLCFYFSRGASLLSSEVSAGSIFVHRMIFLFGYVLRDAFFRTRHVGLFMLLITQSLRRFRVNKFITSQLVQAMESGTISKK